MQQPTQILDMLLGNVNPVQQGVNPKGITAEESDGLAFNNLLLELAGNKALPVTDPILIDGAIEIIDGATKDPNLENEITGSINEDSSPGTAVAIDSEPATSRTSRILEAPIQLMSGLRQLESPLQNVSDTRPDFLDFVIGNDPVMEESLLKEQPGRIIEGSELKQAVADNVAEFNNSLRKEPGLDFQLPKSTLNSLSYREVIDIEPGKYEVINQKIDNSTITLTVKNQQGEAAPIKLSLPMELFETGKMIGSAERAIQRTSLKSGVPGVDRAVQLQNLFDQLNLKEIEVKPLADPGVHPPEQIIAESKGKLLDIKLIAQESGKIMPVLKPVDRMELKASRESVRSESANGKENTEQTILSESNSRINLTAQPVAKTVVNEKAAGLVDRSVLLQQPKEVIDQMMKSDTVLEQQRTLFDPIVASRVQSDAPIDGEKSEPAPVRFVMPDNLKTLLKPNGNSITIKIDPEHLGPARLNLSMHNNVLKARIQVDNVHVRSVVEASVEHLVDQLSRADIKVDQIEVSLSGNSFRDDFGGRRNFHYSSKSRQARPHRTAGLDKIAPALPAQALTAQYVGSHGVNILA